MIRIQRNFYGYELGYSPESKEFCLLDEKGSIVERAPTQEKAQELAVALKKMDFKRIRIFRVYQDGDVTTGEVTSVNPIEGSAWVNMKANTNYGGGTQKITLTSTGGTYYAQTPANQERVEQIKALADTILQAKAGIRALVCDMEKPITRATIGLQ